MVQPGFFDLEDRHALLQRLGDPLPKLNEVVDWETFRPLLKKLRKKKDRRKGGRPAFDEVLMLKVLVLQQLYNLSDDQVEFQIRDRYSFCRFLKLSPEGRVPDAKTVWLYRERIKRAGLMERLFDGLLEQIGAAGYVARRGQIVDATMVQAPRQRNTREENEKIKGGEVPAQWSDSKRSQKDVDARWTLKYGQRHYGYKNHVSVDREHKLVRSFEVSDASSHDGRYLEGLLDGHNTSRDVWADAMYRSREREAMLKELGFRSHVQRQGQASKPLTERELEANHKRAKQRIRVEHVFGAQQAMGRKIVRTIGLERAKMKIGMMNFVYNLKRWAWLSENVRPPPRYVTL